MAEVVAAMDTVWNTVVAPLPDGVAPAVVAYERIDVVNNLKSYSLRNGTAEEVEPYLLTAAIPQAYHWVPINGLAPKLAMRCVDGFIRSYLYRLTRYGPTDMTAEKRRKAAIVLGTCRAVMINNYELNFADINPQELAAPLLSVVVPAVGNPVYTSLVSGAEQHVALLTAPLVLTPAELEVVKVLARSAQAIIPVQGLNLITDGHHYLSEKSKQSYKAFLAVEKQVWVPSDFKTWVSAGEEDLRDWIWHKAGHPVAVSLKENAATSMQVKANLELVKMGSAAARLPALESDLRAAETYLKLAEAVGAVWATMGGAVKCDILRFRVEAVKTMARSGPDYDPPFPMGEGASAANRAEAIGILKLTVAKNTDKAALLYGFYCAMLDSGTGDGQAGDTLKSAFSLRKLRANNIGSYLVGTDKYRDYRAMKAALRKAPEKKMPTFAFDA